jgi:signal transduction histidine kinase
LIEIVDEAGRLHVRLDDLEARAQVDGIRIGARSLLGIVNNLLNLSKIEAGKLDLRTNSVEVGALCRDVVVHHRERAVRRGLNLALESSLQSDLWVETDGVRLRQVLSNLVGNAIRLTEKGTVWLCVEAHGNSMVDLRFRVVDTGSGVTEALRGDALPPLSAVETQPAGRAGTGLSLAVSRRLVTLLGGEVAVHSVEGRGTEFAFALALRRGRAGTTLVLDGSWRDDEGSSGSPGAGPALPRARSRSRRPDTSTGTYRPAWCNRAAHPPPRGPR